MKRVTNLDWEVTSHRSQVTRSRHIWTDFRARAVSFGRKILLWASIMFAQRLTICEIDAKFSIFPFSSSHPWHYRPGYRQGGPHMTDSAPTLVIRPIWGCQCRGHYKWYILHTGSGGRVITVGKCITTDDDGERGEMKAWPHTHQHHQHVTAIMKCLRGILPTVSSSHLITNRLPSFHFYLESHCTNTRRWKDFNRIFNFS